MHHLNILIIGGTGFIGRTLAKTLLSSDHKITVLSRNLTRSSMLQGHIAVWNADISTPGIWQERIPDYEVIINLSGASIFRRWTSRGKQEILDSRILTTRNIVDSIKQRHGNVRQFISVSGVGYYGFHGDEVINEKNTAGPDFIAQVADQWEKAAQPILKSGARLVICRLGHVLGRHGGALPKLVALARLHLGSAWGNGNQWISWVHEEDLSSAIKFLIDIPDISGPVNITSPHPVRNREFMEVLTKTIGKPVMIPPVPEFALKLILGQFHSVFVNGQRVIPEILQQQGFGFKFPHIDKALNDLLKADGMSRSPD